jgi:hypothetical protein
MFKGNSQCTPEVGILYFGPFNPFHYSPLPLYLPPSILQQLSVHIFISSVFTAVMFYDIIDALSFGCLTCSSQNILLGAGHYNEKIAEALNGVIFFQRKKDCRRAAWKWILPSC